MSYPPQPGVRGTVIVGDSRPVYPKLFVQNGHEIITWKEGINDESN